MVNVFRKNFIYKIAVALMIFISAFLFLKEAQAFDRETALAAWKENRKELESLESKKSLSLEELKSKNELLKSEYRIRDIYFTVVSEDYLLGKLTSSEIDESFKGHDQYQKYLSHFSANLLKASINRLKQSKILEIQKIMKIYDSVYGMNDIPLFRITGEEINRNSPTEEKGGFHRGHQSIFMNITKVPSNEWLFIFMHELYHALDSKLHESSIEFANEDLVDSIRRTIKRKKSLENLTQKELENLDRFVTAGLNRNLFAEYRDWSFGFSVYENGINEGLWKKIPFIENVLSYKDKNESVNSFVYRYLNERAKISEDTFLGHPIIQQKIAEKREQFRPE